MPRLAGQIDVAKTEAILEAAREVLAERGVAAVDEIARRAQVSKQTVYNHFGSKADLVRALCAQGVQELTAPLDGPEAVERPRETLAAYGETVLRSLQSTRNISAIRAAIGSVATTPEIAQTLYEAGALASRRRVAEFIDVQAGRGVLSASDPMDAAMVFSSLLLGPSQMAALYGVLEPMGAAEISAQAQTAVDRFFRLFEAN